MKKDLERFKETVAKLSEVASNVGGRLRSYSGRGMFGAECLGISCEDATTCIEEASSHGIRGASQDSLGLRSIVYWRSLKIPEGFTLPGEED